MFHNNKLISFFFLLFIIFLEKNVIEVTTKQEFDALFTKEKGNRVVAGFYDKLYFDKSFSNSFFFRNHDWRIAKNTFAELSVKHKLFKFALVDSSLDDFSLYASKVLLFDNKNDFVAYESINAFSIT